MVACAVSLMTAANGTPPLHRATSLAPLVDHHQHLLSPMLAGRLFDSAQEQEPLTADRLIAQLDAAGIQRAAVLSLGYMHGSPKIRRDDEYAQVRAENDWTSQQVAKYPDRLRALCSVNPLREYAVTELDRCAKDPVLSNGLKLHFANSQVDLQNTQHVEQVRKLFRAANARRMAIVVHVWTGDQRVGKPYGRAEAQVFLNDVLPAAPDILIQIAHLAGAGPGLDRGSKEALAVFADAISAGDSRTRNVYFDVATTVTMQTSADDATLIVARLRQIGLHRILYGSDMAIAGNPTARQGWAAFRERLPLTEAEFKTVAQNVASYMR
jgi:predicted TIM-barrel fold metal-dependent hydrolase